MVAPMKYATSHSSHSRHVGCWPYSVVTIHYLRLRLLQRLHLGRLCLPLDAALSPVIGVPHCRQTRTPSTTLRLSCSRLCCVFGICSRCSGLMQLLVLQVSLWCTSLPLLIGPFHKAYAIR